MSIIFLLLLALPNSSADLRPTGTAWAEFLAG